MTILKLELPVFAIGINKWSSFCHGGILNFAFVFAFFSYSSEKLQIYKSKTKSKLKLKIIYCRFQ